MSEKLNTNSEKTPGNNPESENNGSHNLLSELKDQFNPEDALKARQKAAEQSQAAEKSPSSNPDKASEIATQREEIDQFFRKQVQEEGDQIAEQVRRETEAIMNSIDREFAERAQSRVASSEPQKKPSVLGRIRGLFSGMRERRAERRKQKLAAEASQAEQVSNTSTAEVASQAARLAEATKGLEEYVINPNDRSYYDITPQSLRTAKSPETTTQSSAVRPKVEQVSSQAPVATKTGSTLAPRQESSPTETAKETSQNDDFGYENIDLNDIDTSYIGTPNDPIYKIFKRTTAPEQPGAQNETGQNKAVPNQEKGSRIDAYERAFKKATHIKAIEGLGLRAENELTEEEKELLSDSELKQKYEEKSKEEDINKLISDDSAKKVAQNEQSFLRNGGYAGMARRDYEEIKRLQKEREQYP